MAISLLSRNQHDLFRNVLRDNDVDIEKKIPPKVAQIKMKRTVKKTSKKRFGRRSFGRRGSRSKGPMRKRHGFRTKRRN
jgi:hypothetical protein